MLAECLKVCRDGFSLRGEVGVGIMQVPGRDFLWILYHKGQIYGCDVVLDIYANLLVRLLREM